MAAFLNVCRFTPTAGGTTDWTYSTAVTGYNTPALAGAVNGTVYKYRAESSDLSQWELGEGAYNSGTGVFARTTVLYNSAGTGTGTGQSGAGSKISFSTVPQVAIVALKEDQLSIEEGNSFTATQQAQARANLGVSKKNYIINGAMMISQQNGSTAVVGGAYPVDIFRAQQAVVDGVYSVQQVASLSPAGSPNRVRYTVTTADATVGATNLIYFEQRIEGLRVADLAFGTASAKTITIQFGVKAPAGTYCIAVLNGTPNRSYVAEYVIAGGEADTDVVKSVTIPGDTSGTWLATNGLGMIVRWGLQVGSNFQQAAGSWSTGNVIGSSNQFNFMGTLGNVFEIFDVGLYEGSAAPAFQVPDLGDELAACQRYYEKSFNLDVVPASSAGLVGAVGWAQPVAASTSAIMTNVGYATPKRATPTTITFFNPSAAGAHARNTGAGSDYTLTAAANSGETGFVISATTPAGSAAGQTSAVHWTSDARL